MTINYRKTHLTDGTQVKITEELYQQLKQWEQEGYEIPFQYSDMLKMEDNEMINANRQYYRHNIPLDERMLRTQINLPVLDFNSMENQILKKERSKQLMKVLDICSETQRRRFIKHYYLGLSKCEIARQEDCSEKQVRKSISIVEKLLINCEQF